MGQCSGLMEPKPQPWMPSEGAASPLFTPGITSPESSYLFIYYFFSLANAQAAPALCTRGQCSPSYQPQLSAPAPTCSCTEGSGQPPLPRDGGFWVASSPLPPHPRVQRCRKQRDEAAQTLPMLLPDPEEKLQQVVPNSIIPKPVSRGRGGLQSQAEEDDGH